MKVYFYASAKGKQYFEENYRDIAAEIQDQGFQLLNNSEQAEKHSGEIIKDIDTQLKLLHEAEIAVFEASFPCPSTGYLIAKSLELNKPTLLFYFKSNVPYFFQHLKDDRLFLINYSHDNLRKVLQDTFLNANRFRDKRFNFFISPDLLNYLEDTSKRMNVTKSTFIRNLIKEHRKSKP